MENEEMSKADLIAMLVSIREVAKTNGETHTVEHIEKILFFALANLMRSPHRLSFPLYAYIFIRYAPIMC